MSDQRMKKKSTRFITFLRMVISCAVLGIFFAQSAFASAPHQHMLHDYSLIASPEAINTVNCSNDMSASEKGSGSHKYQSDCCPFCQSTSYKYDSAAILKISKLVDTLLPAAKFFVSAVWLNRSDVVREISGFKANWSSQAPPKA